MSQKERNKGRVERKKEKSALPMDSNPQPLLPRQVHYHCAMGKLQVVSSQNEFLSNAERLL